MDENNINLEEDAMLIQSRNNIQGEGIFAHRLGRYLSSKQLLAKEAKEE